MSLDRKDFGAFFADLHRQNKPFAWQERLLDTVLENGRWPDQVVAPTGAGKTSVIDVHVFAQALATANGAVRPPRRLAMVVDRRVLVDDQYEYARALAARLANLLDEPTSDILGEIAALLWMMRVPATGQPEQGTHAEATPGVSPLAVGRLRGGSPPSRAWRDSPTAAAVLCATPDMWGSRLLFRGYGSSPLAWPREAGMLAIDSVVVVDEAHLARQLLHTARRVGQLAQITQSQVSWTALQVVETTATPPPATPANSPSPTTASTLQTVGVDVDDLADDPLLRQRLTRPKPVRLLPVKDWDNPKATSKAVAALADAVVDVMPAAFTAAGTARTVGCFVNTVSRAVAVAQQLRARSVDGRRLRVVMICGQVRPIDLERLRVRYPGVLDDTGNPDVDVVVSTQTLEVGVDLDLAALVTELADGAALAQRAGRVNRRGLRDTGPIVVAVPNGTLAEASEATPSAADLIPDRARSGPYPADQLRQALTWLLRRAADPAGLAPWAVRLDPPPSAATRRTLYQRPELAEAWHWARTSDDLAAEPELDLWLAEDFTQDTSVGVVVRNAMPYDPAQALQLVDDLPLRRHEVFPVPYRTATKALRDLRAGESVDSDRPEPAIVVVRGDDVALLGWRPATDGTPGEVPCLRPGDLVVIDDQVALFTPSTVLDGFSPPVVAPVDPDDPQTIRVTTDDVLQAQADLPAGVWQTHQVGGVVLRIETPRDPETGTYTAATSLAEALTVPGYEPSDDDDRETVRAWLVGQAALADATVMTAAAAELLSGTRTTAVDVIVHRDNDGQVLRALVIDRRRAVADDGIRQVWAPTSRHVTLADHQQAAADRAELLGHQLGLAPELRKAVTLAAAHHDDGKQDPRFQARLGARTPELIAKSRAGTTAEQARRNERRAGLPTGWRHEQRSVVDSWGAVSTPDGPDPQLVARLVGTSHGHGRSTFSHTAGELLQPTDPEHLRATARDIFDLGGWDDLIEATQQRYGVWGCAYLEAILRAADGQVSQEGK